MIEFIRQKTKTICKQSLVFLFVFFIYALIMAFEFFLAAQDGVNFHVLTIVFIIANILISIKVFKFGFRILLKNTIISQDSSVDKSLNITFGLLCYLLLVFQFAIVFMFFYLATANFSVIPEKLARVIEHKDMYFLLKIVLNYVFPNFYKFPSASGIAVVCQFFIGKFTDIFILAFIVEKLKKK